MCYFLGYNYSLINGRLAERRVKPLFPSDFVLSLIANKMSDKDVIDMQDGIWIWQTERELLDKKGNPFRICKPVCRLCSCDNLWGHNGLALRETLKSIFPEKENDSTDSKEWARILNRLAQGAKQSADSIVPWIREQLLTGNLTTGELYAWANTPLEIDWQKARPVIANSYLRDGEKVYRLSFYDAKSHEDELLTVTPYGLKEYKSLLPQYTKATLCGEQMKILFDLKKMAAVTDELDELYSNVLQQLQDSGAFWVNVVPYAESPKDHFLLGIGKESPEFPSMLQKHHIVELQGQYVPEDYPAWTLVSTRWNTPFVAQQEVEPQDCTVSVRFENGMTGRYPLVFMMKKYPGECQNATFAVRGYSLESMRVVITPKK